MEESFNNDTIFNALPESYLVLSYSDFIITKATNQVLSSLELKRENVVGLSFFDLFPNIPTSIIQTVKAENSTDSLTGVYSDKQWTISLHLIDNHSEEHSSLVFCKISSSEENKRPLIHEITDSFPGIIALYNYKTGEYIYINKSVKDIIGYDCNEFISGGIPFIVSLIHPDDTEELLAENDRLINIANKGYPDHDDKRVERFEYRIRTKDNNYKWLQTYGIIFKRDENNEVEQILNVSIDITERKENELKIRQSEQKLTELKRTLEEKVKEGENELLKNEQYYKFMADAIPGILWTADPEGNMEYYSSRWKEYTGMSNEEALKGGWTTILHPDDMEASFNAVNKSLETGTEYKMEHRVRRKDGIFRWFLSRAKPLKDKNGKVIKWFGTSFDITEEKDTLKALEESKTKYQFLADSIPALVYTANPDGQVDYVNKKWFEYSGVSQEDMIPNLLQSTVHEEDIENLTIRFRHSIKTGESFKCEYRLKKYTGEYRWFLGRAIPMKDKSGKIIKWFGSSTDIQEQKEIIEHLAQIEKGLSKSNLELTNKNEELNRINNDLDNFIYTASHDLKAPISNIEGLTNILKEEESYKNNDIQAVLNLMEKSTERFKKTIEGLTDVAKIQKAVNESTEEIFFNELLNEVLDDISEIKESKAYIEADFHKQPSIYFSKKNLRSILYNLLSNAIKYKAPDRSPKIIVTSKNTPEYTQLIIKDNGLGIEMSNKEKVFKMFKRLHTHTEGTGIGLYIVKRIMDNAGGKIEIESEINKGTAFILYFKKPL